MNTARTYRPLAGVSYELRRLLQGWLERSLSARRLKATATHSLVATPIGSLMRSRS